jgi:hypothetical protein
LIGSAFAKGRDLLRGTLLFSGLSDQDADAIFASAHRTRYPARATIFVKGAPGQSMMAISQGRVSYGERGPEGLLKDKRAIVVETRGGVYTTGPAASFNHQEPHLKTLLGFIGISDVQFIHAEGLDMGPESRANGLAHAKSAIEQVLDGCVAQAA